MDGTYELFRAFFAKLPPRISPTGQDVKAVNGVLESIRSLLAQPGVTHLAVATDHVIESFRNNLFPGYKTGTGIPEELFAQFPLLEEALQAMGVVVWPMVEFEADDAIATAANRWQGDAKIVIETPDKDMMQCVVGERVVTHDRRRDIFYDHAGVVEKFGVEPMSIPDYLALVGDTADGVPGIAGWGAKSAAAVLSRYQKLEDIPVDYGDWEVTVRSGEKLAGVLSENLDLACFYRTLTTLRTDVILPESLADLEWKGITPDLSPLCQELGFPELADRFR